jgi:hypothetical protein
MAFLAAASKSEFCLADIENIIADVEDAFSILASPAGSRKSEPAAFNVQNAFNAIPPDVIRSSSNPGGINTPIGEDLMGRYFIIGIRGDL